MSYTRKAVLGVGAIIAIHLVAALLGYAFRFVLARKLGVENYGLFFSVLAFFLLFSTLKDLGIGNALIITLPKLYLKKKWDQIKSHIVMTYYFKLALAAAFSIILWMLTPALAEHLFKTPTAIPLLRIMTIVFFLSIHEDIYIPAFLGFQKYVYYACIELFKKVLLILFLFIFLNQGPRAPTLAYLATAILLPFALYPLLARTFSLKKHTYLFSKSDLKVLILLGLPFVFNTVTYSIISYFDTLLLTSLRTLHEVGLYNAALPIAMAVLYFMYAFDSVIQPLSSELYHSKKHEKLTLGLRYLHQYLLAGLLPILIFIFAYAPAILHIFYGTTFVPASTALKILMIGILCYALALVNLSVLSGIGQPKTVAKIMFLAALSNVVLNLIFIPIFGMNGAAATTVLSYVLALILSCFFLSRFVTLQLPWMNWTKTILVGLMVGLGIIAAQGKLGLSVWIEAPLIAIIALLIYAALLFALRAVHWEEILVLWKDVTQRKI